MAEYDPVRKEELRIMGFEEFRRKPGTPIMAKKVVAETQVRTKHGQVTAAPGQYVVEKADGEQYPITVEDLTENYLRVEGDVDPATDEPQGPVGFPAEIGVITEQTDA